jgi:hypothetical protein
MDPPSRTGVQVIEIDLQAPGQLFNSMDRTPFLLEDLDRDAEELLVRARECALESVDVEVIVEAREAT